MRRQLVHRRHKHGQIVRCAEAMPMHSWINGASSIGPSLIKSCTIFVGAQFLPETKMPSAADHRKCA